MSPPLQRFGDGLLRHEKILFAALVLVQLVPIWSVRNLPTQDGAAHTYNAMVLKEYHLPERAEWRRYFTLTKDLDPYWTVNLALAGLLYVFPPAAAEKVLVSFYVILFPLALRYLLLAVNPRSAYVSWLVLPFVLNHFYQIGFYGFCLSLTLYAFMLGNWLKYQAEPSMGRLWKMGLLGVMLYFTHIASYLMAGVAIGVLGIWFTGGDAADWRKNQMPRKALLRTLARRWLWPMMALLPSAVLAGEFTAKFMKSPPRSLGVPLEPLEAAKLLLAGRWTWMFNGPEEMIVRFVFWGILAAALYVTTVNVRKPGPLEGFLTLILLYLAFFFRAPEGEVIHLRVIPYILLCLITWIGTLDHGPRFKLAVQAPVLAAVLALAVLFTANYRRFDGWWRDCLSANSYLEPNRTLLYISFAHSGFPVKPTPEGRFVMSPMQHTGCYAAAEKRMISLNDYEAQEKYLPVQYHAAVNPYRHLGDYLELQQPFLNLAGYNDKTPGEIDYILVWGASAENLAKPFAPLLFAQIYRDYDMLYKSPSGLTGLFRRKDLAGAAV